MGIFVSRTTTMKKPLLLLCCLACAQAHAIEMMGKLKATAHDKLVNRLLEALRVHHSDLDRTMYAKEGTPGGPQFVTLAGGTKGGNTRGTSQTSSRVAISIALFEAPFVLGLLGIGIFWTLCSSRRSFG